MTDIAITPQTIEIKKESPSIEAWKQNGKPNPNFFLPNLNKPSKKIGDSGLSGDSHSDSHSDSDKPVKEKLGEKVSLKIEGRSIANSHESLKRPLETLLNTHVPVNTTEVLENIYSHGGKKIRVEKITDNSSDEIVNIDVEGSDSNDFCPKSEGSTNSSRDNRENFSKFQHVLIGNMGSLPLPSSSTRQRIFAKADKLRRKKKRKDLIKTKLDELMKQVRYLQREYSKSEESKSSQSSSESDSCDDDAVAILNQINLPGFEDTYLETQIRNELRLFVQRIQGHFYKKHIYKQLNKSETNTSRSDRDSNESNVNLNIDNKIHQPPLTDKERLLLSIQAAQQQQLQAASAMAVLENQNVDIIGTESDKSNDKKDEPKRENLEIAIETQTTKTLENERADRLSALPLLNIQSPQINAPTINNDALSVTASTSRHHSIAQIGQMSPSVQVAYVNYIQKQQQLSQLTHAANLTTTRGAANAATGVAASYKSIGVNSQILALANNQSSGVSLTPSPSTIPATDSTVTNAAAHAYQQAYQKALLAAKLSQAVNQHGAINSHNLSHTNIHGRSFPNILGGLSGHSYSITDALAAHNSGLNGDYIDIYGNYHKEGLTPHHLKKAKLMFFYTRYPSSSILKTYFSDVRFNRATTSQLIKWFSNFREFFYIHIEKMARQAVQEGVTNPAMLNLTRDTELIRVLNNHYNKSNQFEVPLEFIHVGEQALREFFNAIRSGKDQDPSWKKTIYKVICKLDGEIPMKFKQATMPELGD